MPSCVCRSYLGATGNSLHSANCRQIRGSQTTVVKPDGIREYNFEFNGRGRGPKLHTRVKFGENNLPVFLETSGRNYFNSPFSETFALSDGVAKWKINAYQGEKKVVGDAFYISASQIPEGFAVLSQVLLKSLTKHISLLPAGEASIEQSGELTLREKGKNQRVTAYEINFGSAKTLTIWLDENDQFFALNTGSWTTVIREGWEASERILVKTQDQLATKRYSKLFGNLTRIPAKPIIFTNVNLFDSETGKMRPHTTVVIKGKLIKAVGESGKIKVPTNAETIDATGKTLMPGLWDMRVHISPGEGISYLAGGVTSVRDLGNDLDRLHSMVERINSNVEIGPRISSAVMIDGRGAYTGPTRVLVDTEAEAKVAIKTCKQLHCAGIKIYSSIKPELIPIIIKLARAERLRVGGHVPAFMTAEQFVNAGADEFQHANFLFLNFLFNEVKDTRTPARFTEVAERAATIDLTSERVRSFVKLLKGKKSTVDPTLNFFEDLFTKGGLPVPEGKNERYRNSFKAMMEMVKILYEAGVPLVAGTDGGAAQALHRESAYEFWLSRSGFLLPTPHRTGSDTSKRIGV